MDKYKLLSANFGEMVIEASQSSHPNEMNFSGTLVRLDEESTKAPNGSRGHKILIPKALAEKKVNTLIGMGVNYSGDLEKHEPTNKVGVIQKAWIEGNAIKVSGIIWKKDFPDAEKKLKQKNLGMSFEASDIDVEDQNATVWRLSDLCFTGAAILYKASAAYYKTDAMAASGMSAELIKTKNGGVNMAIEKNKKKPSVAASGENISVEALTVALSAAMKPVVAQLNHINAGQASLRASIEEANLAAIEAAAKKAMKSDGEEEMDATMDDEEMASEAEVEAAKKKAASADDEDDDEDDMDSSADDEDELEDLDDESMHDEDQTPGKFNSDIEKNKGSKTTVSTKKDKHKTVSASSKLTALVEKLTASCETLKAENTQLKKQLKAQAVKMEAAGERTERRSIGSLQLNNLLKKEGYDTNTISASGEKITVEEFDAMLAKGQLSTSQKIAIKSEAARLGVMDEGQLVK